MSPPGEFRGAIHRGEFAGGVEAAILAHAGAWLRRSTAGPQPASNLTDTVLHTNFGPAPLLEEVVAASSTVAGATDLEPLLRHSTEVEIVPGRRRTRIRGPTVRGSRSGCASGHASASASGRSATEAALAPCSVLQMLPASASATPGSSGGTGSSRAATLAARSIAPRWQSRPNPVISVRARAGSGAMRQQLRRRWPG